MKRSNVFDPLRDYFVHNKDKILAKSCPYCVRNSLLEDQKHSIVSKIDC